MYTFLDRTSSMMLKMRSKRGNSFFVPDVSRKVSSFSPLSMMLAIGFCKHSFIKLREFPCVYSFLRVFIVHGFWILSNVFTASTTF